jgi:hypothetical protein
LDEIQTLGLTPSMTNGHVYYWGYALDQEKILGAPRAQAWTGVRVRARNARSITRKR